ncbi:MULTISPECIES: phage tail tube assembly chaperone [Leuconostoc]|uniref:phage tail tube assembly chaperone n=1 Tax=Leuconostoc TaxID=1243 RepID=UPI000B9D59BD|nr:MULTISPECIES: phage tail tube assembly chaperone [Leuconostoc]MCT4377384.1 hypothetical protein [Leuconostoc suionicum]NYS22722.1 hypothetical protein [Leuconostoc sp. DB-1]BAX73344.1 hypothetical protein LEMES_01901 [Leuconostoc mesenteroides]
MAVNTEKIKLNKFGIRKTVSIKKTFGLREEAIENSIKLGELADTEGMEFIDIQKNELKSSKIKMDVIKSIFGISDEEMDELTHSVSSKQFSDAYEYVELMMMGVSEEEYENLVRLASESQEEVNEEDPKEDLVE